MPHHAEADGLFSTPGRAAPMQPGLEQRELAIRSLGAPLEHRDWSMAAILVLAIMTLIGVFAMLPSAEEKVAILMEEQQYDRAIELLEALEERGSLNQYENFTLTRLYLLSGEDRRALSLLEKEMSRNPNSEWALRELIKLVELYRAKHDLDGEVRVLRQVIAIQPNAVDYRRLLALYRLTGRYSEERELLGQVVANGLARPTDVARLAWLESWKDQPSPVTVWSANPQEFSNIPGMSESEDIDTKAPDGAPVVSGTITSDQEPQS